MVKQREMEWIIKNLPRLFERDPMLAAIARILVGVPLEDHKK